MTNSSVAEAISLLQDVLKETEVAASAIMDQAMLLSTQLSETSIDDTQKSAFQETINQVIAACSFQDLSGQRVSNVLKILENMQENNVTVSSNNQTISKEDSLKNGPQSLGNAPDQEQVDKLFNKGA